MSILIQSIVNYDTIEHYATHEKDRPRAKWSEETNNALHFAIFYPFSGKHFDFSPTLIDNHLMNAEQRRYLLDHHDLSPELLDRLMSDIWSSTSQTPEQHAQSRHAQLAQEGKRNEEIFAQIQKELAEGRFAAEPTSLRQIRRMIYG